MERKNLLGIFICFVFFFLALLSTEGFNWSNLRYGGNAITTDEMAHIPSGYYYLKTGKYFLNPEHPPLVKDISALPLLFLKPVLPVISSDIKLDDSFAWHRYPPDDFVFSNNLEINNAQWDWAGVFLFNPQNNPDLIAFWARLSVIFFNALFLFLLYVLLSSTWSKRVAFVSLFLIVFSQFNIAHGSLVAMDFMSSLLQILAIVSFSMYIRNFVEEKRAVLLFSVSLLFLCLALLSKFSSIILIPTLFVGGLIYIILTKKSYKHVLNFFVKFSILSFLALLLVSIYYFFHTFNMNNDDMIAQLEFIHKNNLPFRLKEFLTWLIFSNPILKGIAQYFSGVLMVFSRMSVAYQKIFFMRNIYGAEGAGLLYFPVLYATKLSVGLLLLNLFAILLIIKNALFSKKMSFKRIKNYLENPSAFFLVIFICLFILATLSSNLQIGLRHILPIILGLTLLTAKVIDSVWDCRMLKIKFNYIFYVIFFAMVFSVLISFPNYLSFYNLFAGGTDNGYKIATDSNFDWGQDTKKLVKYVEDNNVDKIYIDLDIEGFVPLGWYLGSTYKAFNSNSDFFPEANAYVALSITKYEIYKNKYTVLRAFPIQKIGKTIVVFQMP